MAKLELKAKVPVAEKVAAEVNAPLETGPLYSGEAHICAPCGRVLAMKKPGEKLVTRGGETLDAVPECPGIAEKEHGPWAPEVFDLASVRIDLGTGRAISGRLVS